MATLALWLAVMNSFAAGNRAVPTKTGHREGIDRISSGLFSDPVNGTNLASRKPEPKWHSVVVTPKANLPPIRWYDKINPIWWLGNVEEPIPPAWYEPTNSLRKLKWYCRNPFTNLSNFVIGVADKETVRSGRYPTEVGNPNGGWNVAVTRRRLVYLPFVDYKNRRLEFYFGWRERGNFGIKLNIHGTPAKIKNKTALDANNCTAPKPLA